MQADPVTFSVRCISVLACCFLLVACSNAYYSAMEQVGIHKRNILVDRVEDARDSQEDAKQQFSSALEQFSALLDFDGGDLQTIYNSLEKEFESSEQRANEVRDRIEAVESVSEALFEEWEDELELYTSQSLRQASENTLNETRTRYGQMIASMHAAEAKMEPVLNAFRDQVLFLKHNLNSRAIASLRTELVSIEGDISQLIKDMQASIDESNRFLSEMESL